MTMCSNNRRKDFKQYEMNNKIIITKLTDGKHCINYLAHPYSPSANQDSKEINETRISLIN